MKFVMAVFISMLRGINVAGQKKVSMNELVKVYESLKLKNIKTYIQSGNVVFEYSNANTSKLAGTIEAKIKQHFKFDVSVLIRVESEFLSVIKNNPYHSKDPSKTLVTFLSEKPRDIPIDELNKAKDKTDGFSVDGKQVYLFCPN